MKKIFEQLLDHIPDYQEFFTVDEMDESSKELARQFPDVASLFEIGKTREDHPLYCLKIGSGSKNALMFGLPHPNEPIGTMMLEYFTWQLAQNAQLREALDYTWYIVKAWDADGTKKNEKWFKGPFTITNYMRNFFRPAGFEQVDWTFPIDYKELHFSDSIPETLAMMKLIDDIKPHFIYSLHNAGFGGAYWYMSWPLPDSFDELHKVPAKYHVPIHMGEPESPACEEFAKAIYANMGISAEYDFREQYSGDMKEFVKAYGCGDNSASYARERYDSFTLLTELPYFYDPRIDDCSPSDITRKDAILRKLEDEIRMNLELREILAVSRDYLSADNHFLLAVEAFTHHTQDEMASEQKRLDADPKFSKVATVAEKFDNLLVSKFYKTISYAMLLRANESELARMDETNDNDPVKRAALETGRQRSMEGFEKITAFLEENMHYQVVPIKNLVGVQLECGLIVADALLNP